MVEFSKGDSFSLSRVCNRVSLFTSFFIFASFFIFYVILSFLRHSFFFTSFLLFYVILSVLRHSFFFTSFLLFYIIPSFLRHSFFFTSFLLFYVILSFLRNSFFFTSFFLFYVILSLCHFSFLRHFQGAHYVTDSVAREQTGNYTCSARNQLSPSGRESEPRDGFGTLQLIVQCELHSLLLWFLEQLKVCTLGFRVKSLVFPH